MKRILLILAVFFVIFVNLLFSANYKLQDTSVTKCYDNSKAILCPGDGEDYYGQDAQYQGINPKFIAKKINGDKVVIDENTELMWMQYTADTNNDGQIADNDILTWHEAIEYCSNLTYAGYTDWRLPTIFEASTIVNYGTYDPSIDTNVFEAQSSFYWSSTTSEGIPDYAWFINFFDGTDYWDYKFYRNYVRCVRGGLINQGPYIDNGDSTLTDKSTELIWMKATADINGDEKIDNNDTATWKEALSYCENLNFAGYTDWRLPSIRELRSIVRYNLYDSAIDTSVFECEPFDYWSSTTDAVSSDYAWYIYFKNGNAFWYSKSYRIYVRCVREGLFDNLNECSNANLKNCLSEFDCKESKGYWYNNVCYNISKNAYPEEPLKAEILSFTNLNLPRASDHFIVVRASENIFIQPSLKVDNDDIEKRATLLLYIYVNNLDDGFMLPEEELELKEIQKFTNIPEALDIRDYVGWSFNLYYGYKVGDTLKYNAYKVEIVE